MALVLSDRVKETTTTSGTGSLTLGGAVGGFVSFESAIGEGNTTYYVIENDTRWEIGVGTYSSGSLSRDTVLSSSSGSSKISLSGVSFVFCALPASKTNIWNEESGDVSLPASLSLPRILVNHITSSGDVLSSGLTSFVRTDAGNFFHAYVDDVNKRTLSLYTDATSAPEWKLGLKSNPDSATSPPTYAYIHGEDGNIGLYANSLNSLSLTHGGGFDITNKSNSIFKSASATGTSIIGNAAAYPTLVVKSATAQSANIQEWQNSSETTLAKITSDGSLLLGDTNILTDIRSNSASGETNAADIITVSGIANANSSDIVTVSGIASAGGLPVSSGSVIQTNSEGILANSASGLNNLNDIIRLAASGTNHAADIIRNAASGTATNTSVSNLTTELRTESASGVNHANDIIRLAASGTATNTSVTNLTTELRTESASGVNHANDIIRLATSGTNHAADILRNSASGVYTSRIFSASGVNIGVSGLRFNDGTTQTTAGGGGSTYTAGSGIVLQDNKFHLDFGSGNAVSGYNQSYTDIKVAALVDSAPATLNTLNELAAAINDDANISTTLTNLITANTTEIRTNSASGLNNANDITRLASSGTNHAADIIRNSASGTATNTSITNLTAELRTESASGVNHANDIIRLAASGTNHAADIIRLATSGTNHAADIIRNSASGTATNTSITNLTTELRTESASGVNHANDIIRLAASGTNHAADIIRNAASGTAVLAELRTESASGVNHANDIIRLAASGTNHAADILRNSASGDYTSKVLSASGVSVGVSGIRFSDGTTQTSAPTDTDTTYTSDSGVILQGTTFNANLVDYTVQTTAAESRTTTASRTYAVQVDSSDKLVVNVPWTAGGGGGGLTEEEAQDIVGAQFVTNGSHTLITAAYDDAGDGAIDLTVDNDLSNYDNSTSAFITATLTTEQVQDIAGPLVADGGTKTGISITYDDTNGDMDFVVDHNTASNFVANEHIDHTSVTLTAGDGLTGGGDISANRTFTVVGDSGVLVTDKVHANLVDYTVQSTAANSRTTTASRTYAVQVDSSDKLVVNVPWSDTDTTYSEATSSSEGLMSTAHHDKLDGIEANATADQTNAEIRAAVEAATDSNVFTDADHTKLDGIAASANNYTLPSASDTVVGGVELATTSETTAGTDTTRAVTPAGVQAAIDALVDSAPGTLNTLNELAAAIGDDADYASTITTALAGKQAVDAGLTSIAGLTTAADKMIYTTGSDTYAVADLTAAARGLLDDANVAAMRTTLGVDAAGTDNSTDVTLNTSSHDYLSISTQAITLGPIDLTADVTGDLPISEGGTGASTASAARTNLGVDAAGTDNSTDVTLVTSSHDYLSISTQAITLGPIDLTADVTGDLPVSEGGTGASTASAARTNLGVAIGSNVQAHSAILDDIAGLTQAADKLPYFNASTTAATTDLSAFGRSLIDDADAATARTTLGVDAAGTDNSTNVTLVTDSHDYLSISSQAITLGQIDIGDDTNLAGGDGLTLTGDTLSVNVDDSTIETNSDSLRVKDAGITLAKMANLADMKVIGNTSGGSATPAAVSILDEDDMASDSATALATQQSIKAYVDANSSGGGGVDAANGANNRIATFTDSDSLNGEANLTFDGSALALTGTFTVGVDDTGHDVKFFGARSGSYVEWDESENRLHLVQGAYVNQPVPATGSTTEDGTLQIDLSKGNYFNILLGDDISAVEFQNATIGQKFIIRFIQRADATAGHGISWSTVRINGSVAAELKWASNIAPTMTGENNTDHRSHKDVYGFLCTATGGSANDTKFDGFIIGQDIPD